MATAVPAAPPRRHALGLPAGSIRALLALGVLGYMWLLALGKDADGKPLLLQSQASVAFIYLQFLMILILAHFFSAHGHSIAAEQGRRSPLGLPKGSVRLILLAGYLGLAYFTYQANLGFAMPDTGPILLLILILVSGYFLGYVVSGAMRTVTGPNLPAWFLDVQAWFALVGMLLMGVIVLARVINMKLGVEQQIPLELVEAILAGVVGFYFGARS
ncbi:MAG: hypothetical protein K2W96_23475 [Gemmataceae bacterium]|nr:hypothetical protein [Gemmataceae bacterium]